MTGLLVSGRRDAWAPVLAAALALHATGCGGLPASVPRVGAFDAQRLEGGWHVLASNFPMWLEGKRTEPIFIYRLQTSGDAATLDDTVAYTESGRRETIEGTDTQDPSTPAHFTWRGKGLLGAFSSDWVVAHESPDQRWMVLYFTKTFATPEGVDVIAKMPVLSPEDRAAVDKVLAENPFLKGKAGGLVWLGPRTGK
jgi:lipocalin